MKKMRLRTRLAAGLLLLAGLAVAPSAQAAYTGLYIFGDSLSDSGNNAIATGGAPPTTNTTNADFSKIPYSPSGTYSNGPTWTSSFASALGLSATPSLSLGGGNNYAFGGAQTWAPGTESPEGYPFSLNVQTQMYLGSHGGVADSGALYVLQSGGNNVRAALEAIGGGADVMATIASVAAAYATDTGILLDRLQSAGGQRFVVWNTPDFGLTPFAGTGGQPLRDLSTLISASMNQALAVRLAGETGVTLFDSFSFLNNAVANGVGFGFSNVADSCSASPACTVPNQYLFWDAIHPTARGHQLIADAMLNAVPEPQSLALLGLGLLMMVWVRRKQQA